MGSLFGIAFSFGAFLTGYRLKWKWYGTLLAMIILSAVGGFLAACLTFFFHLSF